MKYIPVPNKLKEYRKQNNLRQLDVAVRLGFCTTDRISKWEKGRGFPHMVNLFKLCAIYEAWPHELYGELLTNICEEVRSKPKIN